MEVGVFSALETLKRYFGYDDFREGQGALIEGVLKGRDVLGVMPTGAGKSMCFQIPALMMRGITLVVSPLISLMKDQVNVLTQSGIPAAFINSSLSPWQIDDVLRQAANAAYKLIYIAPERLLMDDFMRFAQSVEISMLSADEAHCISQWGQDFRPSYSQIPEFITRLPRRPVLSAFTATATARVREDIITRLELENPLVLVTGFDRRNLYFEVQKPKNKYMALTAFLGGKKDRSGIVYCSTRAMVEEVCEKLKAGGYSASRYHAGLSDSERHDNQDDFLYDRVQIMVATNAFGMGIDKSNVSFVVHYNMPKDMESYYQEAGRAGRDGAHADCLLFYSGQDVHTNIWLIENNNDAQYGYCKQPLDRETGKLLKERNLRRLREMSYYCSTTGCLREYILKYFGENPPKNCNNCGNCGTDFETADITVDAQKILSCVVRMKERYGMGILSEVLRGSKSEKVQRYGLDKLSTYGISEKTDRQLREITKQLILMGYLLQTTDEYPVLKLGERANEVLRGGASVQMKVSAIKKTAPVSGLPKQKMRHEMAEVKNPVYAKEADNDLFTALRKLRLEIANEQKVPAYIIFSDSALIDMCIKTPATDREFLNISGVGQVKLERYGGKFLKAIAQFMQNKEAN